MNIKKILKINKFLSFDFDIYKEFIVGLVLKGIEVREFKNCNFDITNARLAIKNNELFIDNLVIKGFSDPRSIKLLLKKHEIEKILIMLKNRKFIGLVKEVFVTNKNLIKILLVIGTMKRKIDKKLSQKRSTMKRELERSLKQELSC